MSPCLLFCAKEKALDYMREAHYQPHAEVRNMLSREPATLQQSHSSDNPRKMFLTCSKKKCNFFRSADKALGQKYRKWLQNKEDHPLPTRDANGYPLRGYDIPGPPPPPSPRVRCKEDVQRERPLTDYERPLSLRAVALPLPRSTEGSLGGVQRFAPAHKNSPQRVLQRDLAYTLYKPSRRRFPTLPVIVRGLDDQWVADLVEVQPLAKYNRGIRYLLTVLDVLSKYAWVQPLKAKTGVALVKAFDKILKQGRQPNRFQTD